jgi:ABC-type dipeptide/oligopeptide/nickel transport system permease subunit
VTKLTRRLAAAWLLVALLVVVGAGQLAPHSYDRIFSESPDAQPSKDHLLGTDAVSRDRFSRLIHGTRISLGFAPLGAFLATLVAGCIGALSGLSKPWVDRTLMFSCELFISLPWMFLLISARSLMPLNTTPVASVAITFLLLGLLGWAGPARIVRARTREWLNSDQYLFARSLGISRRRAFLIHLPPVLKPVLLAQFWIAIPVFILGEANLSLVGLGVSDPLPSWGALLRDMNRPEALLETPWIITPLLVLVATLIAVQTVLRTTRSQT